MCLMTWGVKPLPVQATLWEFARCLNIMFHTLIPDCGPWFCFLPTQPSFLLHFLNPDLCCLCITACLTRSSITCWLLPHCLLSLAASLWFKWFPQQWVDGFCFLFLFVCLLLWVLIYEYSIDLLYHLPGLPHKHDHPIQVMAGFGSSGQSSFEFHGKSILKQRGSHHISPAYKLWASAQKTAILGLIQSPIQCLLLHGQV